MSEGAGAVSADCLLDILRSPAPKASGLSSQYRSLPGNDCTRDDSKHCLTRQLAGSNPAGNRQRHKAAFPLDQDEQGKTTCRSATTGATYFC